LAGRATDEAGAFFQVRGEPATLDSLRQQLAGVGGAGD
jgi:hypothetical protein